MRILALTLLSSVIFPHSQPAHAQGMLSRENIARRAMQVAVSTQTVGRCYGAVTRALRPLGVELTGEAAYMAKDILLGDKRFMPMVINTIEQLQRGDILVYWRSAKHPYGHISVYEGNNQEASDHLAPVMHTSSYGPASVFRLRRDIPFQQPSIAYAPPVAPPINNWFRHDNPSAKAAASGVRSPIAPPRRNYLPSNHPASNYYTGPTTKHGPTVLPGPAVHHSPVNPQIAGAPTVHYNKIGLSAARCGVFKEVMRDIGQEAESHFKSNLRRSLLRSIRHLACR